MVEGDKVSERVLAQFSFTRGYKNPKQIIVRIFPARSEEHSGKPYVARDLQGNEFSLNVGERIIVEGEILGTADAADLYRKSQQKRIAKLASTRKKKTS